MSFLDHAANPVWSAMGWTMLHFLWIGSILGVLAFLGPFRSYRPFHLFGRPAA